MSWCAKFDFAFFETFLIIVYFINVFQKYYVPITLYIIFWNTYSNTITQLKLYSHYF